MTRNTQSAFWDSIPDNLRNAVQQAVPSDILQERLSLSEEPGTLDSRYMQLEHLLKETINEEDRSKRSSEQTNPAQSTSHPKPSALFPLAMLQVETKQYTAAEETYRKILAANTPSRPDLAAMSNLIDVLNLQHKYTEAQTMAMQVLPLLQKEFGVNSPQYLGSSAQIGGDDHQNGDDHQPESSGLDDKTGSVFSTATDLVLGATTATLENRVTTTPTTSAVDNTAQSLTSSDISTSQTTMQTTAAPSMTTSISWTQPAWRPGWHSYNPSYISTATPSETSAASLTPGLNIQEKAHHGPNATIIAGVVVPIVILLASGLVALTCLRRRRRRAVTPGSDNAAVSDAVRPVAMVEKVAGKKISADGHRPVQTTMLSPIDETTAAPQLPQLVLTSTQNATYFTGLDTFSIHSAATNE
ncbi:hypothetical protein KCV04_g7138, partial [Aureobasidium melanogenum]